MDLDFYVRVRTCKKRVTGKQPLEAICYLLLVHVCKNMFLCSKFQDFESKVQNYP